MIRTKMAKGGVDSGPAPFHFWLDLLPRLLTARGCVGYGNTRHLQ